MVVTEVDSVDLDEAGTYGDWSVDFDDVSLNTHRVVFLMLLTTLDLAKWRLRESKKFETVGD